MPRKPGAESFGETKIEQLPKQEIKKTLLEEVFLDFIKKSDVTKERIGNTLKSFNTGNRNVESVAEKLKEIINEEDKDLYKQFIKSKRGLTASVVVQKLKEAYEKLGFQIPARKQEIVEGKIEPKVLKVPDNLPVSSMPEANLTFKEKVNKAVSVLVPEFEADLVNFIKTDNITKYSKETGVPIRDIVEGLYNNYNLRQYYRDNRPSIKPWEGLNEEQVMVVDLARIIDLQKSEANIENPEQEKNRKLAKIFDDFRNAENTLEEDSYKKFVKSVESLGYQLKDAVIKLFEIYQFDYEEAKKTVSNKALLKTVGKFHKDQVAMYVFNNNERLLNILAQMVNGPGQKLNLNPKYKNSLDQSLDTQLAFALTLLGQIKEEWDKLPEKEKYSNKVKNEFVEKLKKVTDFANQDALPELHVNSFASLQGESLQREIFNLHAEIMGEPTLTEIEQQEKIRKHLNQNWQEIVEILKKELPPEIFKKELLQIVINEKGKDSSAYEKIESIDAINLLKACQDITGVLPTRDEVRKLPVIEREPEVLLSKKILVKEKEQEIETNEVISMVESLESQKVLSKTEIHGDEFNGKILTQKILRLNNLEPKYKITLGEDRLWYCSKPYDLGKGRIAVVAYVKDNDHFVARSYYRSNSHGVWKYLPQYLSVYKPMDSKPGDKEMMEERISWYSKGYGQESITLPVVVQFGLAQINLNETKIEGVPDKELVFAGTARGVYTKKENITYMVRVSETPDYLDGNFYSTGADEKIPPEKLLFNDTKQSADFSKLVLSWTQPSSLYGPLNIEVFKSKDGNKLIMFYMDSSKRVGIASIEGDSVFTTTGLRERFVNSGDLSTPILEYRGEDGGYGEEEGGKGHYVDMFKRYNSKIPLIQEYLEYKGLKPKQVLEQEGIKQEGIKEIEDEISEENIEILERNEFYQEIKNKAESRYISQYKVEGKDFSESKLRKLKSAFEAHWELEIPLIFKEFKEKGLLD